MTDEERNAVRQDLAIARNSLNEMETRAANIGKRVLTAAGADSGSVRFVIGGRYSGVLAYADDKRNVFITPEMMRFVQSDDELAAVLSHEVAHILRGHHGRRKVQMVFSGAAGAVAGAAIDSLGGTPVTGPTAGDMAGAAVRSTLLAPFSKEAENEADTLAVAYLRKAGYDPRAIVAVFRRMAVELSDLKAASFISTHPGTPERMARLAGLVENQGA